jgi:hypothetical protein
MFLHLSPGSRVRISAKTLYPAASSFGASQSASSSSPGVALLRKTTSRASRAKNGRQALPLKQSRLSSELETLRAISKRTFSSGNRMTVQTFLGAIFNLVTRWEFEDRLEEGLYRLLDSLKAPVPLKIGEAFSVVF